MKKILILQPHLDQAQAIAKFLKKYSDNFFITGALTTDDPTANSITFFDHLENVSSDYKINSEEYDIILPTGAKSTKKFLTLHNQVRIGSINFAQENLQAFDKLSMINTIDNLIPVPRTYRSHLEINEFPVFYKQLHETGGGIRGIIYNKEELDVISREKTIFYQEYINSPDTYGVGFLAHDGILITSFIQKELYSYPKAGGSGVILQIFNDKKLIEYTEKILKKIHYSGWGLVEFKYCPKRKDYVFMEVNAKFWASIEFALLNNPVFFQKLFDINYVPQKETKCIIFLNRLAQYGIWDYLSLLLSYKGCYKIFFWNSLIPLVIVSTPKKLKTFLKYFIH
jgi:hypothetical protein